MPEQKHIKLTKDEAQSIISYLANRPFGEAFKLVAMIQRKPLEAYPNEKEPDMHNEKSR